MFVYLKEQAAIAFTRFFFLFNPKFWSEFTAAKGWNKLKVFIIWPEEDW